MNLMSIVRGCEWWHGMNLMSIVRGCECRHGMILRLSPLATSNDNTIRYENYWDSVHWQRLMITQLENIGKHRQIFMLHYFNVLSPFKNVFISVMPIARSTLATSNLRFSIGPMPCIPSLDWLNSIWSCDGLYFLLWLPSKLYTIYNNGCDKFWLLKTYFHATMYRL